MHMHTRVHIHSTVVACMHPYILKYMRAYLVKLYVCVYVMRYAAGTYLL